MSPWPELPLDVDRELDCSEAGMAMSAFAYVVDYAARLREIDPHYQRVLWNGYNETQRWMLSQVGYEGPCLEPSELEAEYF